ncbi:MAG: hypothetical protein FWC76_00780 [Defluviitaleaceae bacterium]|nr:hypothetical protein [Defluviitaleaceae bacterium]
MESLYYHEEYYYEADYNVKMQIVDVNINGDLVQLSGYYDDLFHFRLRDIEDMLINTRSRFRYGALPQDEWRDYYIWRGVADIPEWFLNMAPPIHEGTRDDVPVIREQIAMWTPFDRDGALGYMYALKIGGHHYFTLCSLSAVLGFTVEFDEDGTAWINTCEANISEYGRQAAAQFLAQMPTLFYRDWSEETLASTPYILPWGYFAGEENELYSRFYPATFTLHDFNNNGIPDILLHYYTVSWHGEMRRDMHLFMYIDGSYQEITTISPWGGIFADFEGNIFAIEGNHQESFTHVQKISFDDEEPVVEMIIEAWWWNDDEEELPWDDFIEAVRKHQERYWTNWDYFAPTVPGQHDKSLIAMRPIWDLAESLRDEVYQSLIDEGRIPS